MDDLGKALGDIDSIRRQVARSTEFRGYGPVTMATTGVLGIGAAVLQGRLLPEPAAHLRAYLTLWTVTASISAALAGAQMYTRSRRIHSGLSNEMIRMAVEQFLPALGTGLLLTLVFALYAPGAAWTLPGLWQVIFSLGIFSSCRFLPRPMLAVGFWYLISGLLSLHIGDARAFSPWTMGVPFGIGQWLVAVILLGALHEERE